MLSATYSFDRAIVFPGADSSSEDGVGGSSSPGALAKGVADNTLSKMLSATYSFDRAIVLPGVDSRFSGVLLAPQPTRHNLLCSRFSATGSYGTNT